MMPYLVSITACNFPIWAGVREAKSPLAMAAIAWAAPASGALVAAVPLLPLPLLPSALLLLGQPESPIAREITIISAKIFFILSSCFLRRSGRTLFDFNPLQHRARD